MSNQSCLCLPPEIAARAGGVDQLETSAMNGLAWLFAMVRRRKQRQATKRLLQSLTDHQLQDIGFARADIEARYPTFYSDRAGWPLR